LRVDARSHCYHSRAPTGARALFLFAISLARSLLRGLSRASSLSHFLSLPAHRDPRQFESRGGGGGGGRAGPCRDFAHGHCRCVEGRGLFTKQGALQVRVLRDPRPRLVGDFLPFLKERREEPLSARKFRQGGMQGGRGGGATAHGIGATVGDFRGGGCGDVGVWQVRRPVQVCARPGAVVAPLGAKP